MIHLLTPVFKDYIWGGTRLRDEFGKKTDLSPVAESWELSCHKDGLSLMEDGKALRDYLSANPAALGTKVKGGELPILVKLIDAADNLSVQVHPDEAFAQKHEGQHGKTEMWYIVDASPNAQIIYGLKKPSTREELSEAIARGRAEDLLRSVPAKKGDVFFVEAGTVHAIGKGCLIAEIQQNSNVTYRLYDYNRLGKDGRPRELHIEKGVACANLNPVENRPASVLPRGGRLLGECEFFRVTEHKICGEEKFFADGGSYNALLCVSGSAAVTAGSEKVSLPAGSCAFIDADSGEYSALGDCVLIRICNP